MKSYLIDEISGPGMKKIRHYLEKQAISSQMEAIFWVKLPDDLLSPTQFEHTDCRPHVFAVELGKDWIRLEFFIRSLNNMRCSCPDFCTPQQRNHIIKFADTMIESLAIRP